MPINSKKYKYKSITISILIIFLLTCNSYKCFSQVFGADQNPPSLKWKQIKTENFQIIFPSPLESEAQRMANLFEYAIQRISYSLKKQPKKISIIFQNQGTTSNGFVQLAPRRSEFFTTPSQNFDYQNWLNSLATHELRHVVQFDKLTGHFNSPPLESIALTFFGITLPPWFYEGDAVAIETALTLGGRGRIPEWNIALRSNTLSHKKFSYSKDYFGSLNDFTPGYYQLGFFMINKLRKDHGKDVLNNVYERIYEQPLRPYNLSNSIKKITGINTKKLHDSTINELEKLWQNQLNKNQTITYKSLNIRDDNTPENFLLPTVLKNGTILYLKESKAEVSSINTLSKDGKSKRLFNIGYQEIPWFNYAADKIVWDEFRYDLRYQQRSFNVINIYDFKSRKIKQLTHKSRLFAPALSPDGSLVIAVEVGTSNKISLVEFDANTGKELRRYKSPDNQMLQMPAFNNSGNKIAVIAVLTSGKTILELDRSNGIFTSLIPVQYQEILHPVYVKNQIVFKAHFNGIDNIYRLNLHTKEIFQITSSQFGAFNPSFDAINNRILFNNYSAKGHNISAIDWSTASGLDVSTIKNNEVDFVQTLSNQEGGPISFDSIPKQVYPTKRFKEFNNLFYFHSINPVTDANISGLQLQSDNKLNTLSFYTGYQYNSGYRKSEYTAGFAYKRYYPILNFDYINRSRSIIRSGTNNKVTWRENEFKAQISVPFTFNRLNTNYSVGLKTGTSYTNRYSIDKPFNALVNKIRFPMHYQLYASRNARRSARDLAPKWGQNITFTYRHFPFEDRLQGSLLLLQSSFFFPGIMRNHSIQAYFNWQDGDGNYQTKVDIPVVSGYSYLQSTSQPYNTLFLNYKFPVFYPDWELGPLAYVKRIKAGFFADFQNIGHGNSVSPISYGAELRGDMNLLRFYLPNFDLGGKLIFLNEKPRQNPIFELIATYNF